MSAGQRIGLWFVFLYFLIGGACHFLYMPLFVQIVPPYIPFPLLAVIVSGVFELLGAAGVMIKRTRSAAGIGLTLLTIAVTPANIFHVSARGSVSTSSIVAIARAVAVAACADCLHFMEHARARLARFALGSLN
ncbi:DoxX family protein [Caballeronia eucalypticola]|uniref:DoxX family protein n=1 Tax=Caballeronia sp. 15715 TaxID=3391030 RepID=UPI0039E38BC2